MEEVWRPVVGYEGLYEVSNFSRVKALAKTRKFKSKGKIVEQYFGEKILIPQKRVNGRFQFNLVKEGKQKTTLRSVIVAKAWVGGYQDGYEVNHIDEDFTNDSIENLEWCSHLQNMRHGTRKERAVANMIKAKGRPVIAKKLSGEIVATFLTIAEAARAFGCASSNISKCCLGKIKTLSGMKWEYAVDKDV